METVSLIKDVRPEAVETFIRVIDRDHDGKIVFRDILSFVNQSKTYQLPEDSHNLYLQSWWLTNPLKAETTKVHPDIILELEDGPAAYITKDDILRLVSTRRTVQSSRSASSKRLRLGTVPSKTQTIQSSTIVPRHPQLRAFWCSLLELVQSPTRVYTQPQSQPFLFTPRNKDSQFSEYATATSSSDKAGTVDKKHNSVLDECVTDQPPSSPLPPQLSFAEFWRLLHTNTTEGTHNIVFKADEEAASIYHSLIRAQENTGSLDVNEKAIEPILKKLQLRWYQQNAELRYLSPSERAFAPRAAGGGPYTGIGESLSTSTLLALRGLSPMTSARAATPVIGSGKGPEEAAPLALAPTIGTISLPNQNASIISTSSFVTSTTACNDDSDDESGEGHTGLASHLRVFIGQNLAPIKSKPTKLNSTLSSNNDATIVSSDADSALKLQQQQVTNQEYRRYIRDRQRAAHLVIKQQQKHKQCNQRLEHENLDIPGDSKPTRRLRSGIDLDEPILSRTTVLPLPSANAFGCTLPSINKQAQSPSLNPKANITFMPHYTFADQAAFNALLGDPSLSLDQSSSLPPLSKRRASTLLSQAYVANDKKLPQRGQESPQVAHDTSTTSINDIKNRRSISTTLLLDLVRQKRQKMALIDAQKSMNEQQNNQSPLLLMAPPLPILPKSRTDDEFEVHSDEEMDWDAIPGPDISLQRDTNSMNTYRSTSINLNTRPRIETLDAKALSTIVAVSRRPNIMRDDSHKNASTSHISKQETPFIIKTKTESKDELSKRIALEQSKSNGPYRPVLYDPRYIKPASTQWELQDELRGLIEGTMSI